MHWFEVILIILFWSVQMGITAGLALLLAGIAAAIGGRLRKRKVRLLPRAVIAMVLVCAVLAVFALHPPVTCPEQYDDRITEEQLRAVRSVSRGIYSPNIPLVPVWVEITELRNFILEGQMEHSVEFTVHYLWFGTVGMTHSTYDGYAINKPLTGW